MISTQYRMTCDFCGHTDCIELQKEIKPYSILCHVLPEGWRWVDNKLACRRHDIVVKNKAAK